MFPVDLRTKYDYFRLQK